jgi:hypothetical protein
MYAVWIIFVSKPELPETDCGETPASGTALPEYAILERSSDRPPMSGMVSWYEDALSVLKAGYPVHPAATIAAVHITRSMILWFIQNASLCKIFISVVNCEKFWSYSPIFFKKNILCITRFLYLEPGNIDVPNPYMKKIHRYKSKIM